MAKALPVHLVDQVTSELRLAAKRMFTARSARRNFASQKAGRVNIGCGKIRYKDGSTSMLFPTQACTFGTAGRDYFFHMPLSRRFIRSIFSSILISKPRHAYFFANASGVFNLAAFCASWCPMLGRTCELLVGHDSR